MQSIIVYSLIAAALLVVAVLITYLWEKKSRHSGETQSPDGAFRALYHLLWVLLLWSGMALSIPLWLSYKTHLVAATGVGRWLMATKVIFFPLIIFTLLRYGRRRGYIGWVDSLEWPDKENK